MGSAEDLSAYTAIPPSRQQSPCSSFEWQKDQTDLDDSFMCVTLNALFYPSSAHSWLLPDISQSLVKTVHAFHPKCSWQNLNLSSWFY